MPVNALIRHLADGTDFASIVGMKTAGNPRDIGIIHRIYQPVCFVDAP